MATKKVFLGAKKVSQKPLPQKGDVVLVNAEGGRIIGIFVAYSKRERVVTLEWPKEWPQGLPCLYLWPDSSKSFFNIDPNHISILSPVEILSQLGALVRYRDERISRSASQAVVDFIKVPLYPGI